MIAIRPIPLALAALACAASLAAAGCDPGPSCRDAAEQMVAIANQPVAGEDGDEATKPEARDRLERACEADGWPAVIRSCLVAASDQEAATACMRDLAAGP